MLIVESLVKLYLLSNGGTHPHGGPVLTGIGADKASHIWYLALTTYLTSASNFSDAVDAHLRATRDIYGANGFEFFSVEAAWSVCGIGNLPTPDPTELVQSSTLESNLHWVLTGSNAVAYLKKGPSHLGRGYAVLGVNNSVSGTLYQDLNMLPANAICANLTFWLMVASTDTSGIPNDNLYVEIIDQTNSVVLLSIPSYSNINAGGSYIQQGPFDLLPYKSYSLRLSFRVVTDGNIGTTFYVDDVSIKYLTF